MSVDIVHVCVGMCAALAVVLEMVLGGLLETFSLELSSPSVVFG